MIGRPSGELLLNFHAKNATQEVRRWSFEVARRWLRQHRLRVALSKLRAWRSCRGVTLKTAKFLKKTENSRSFLKTVRFPLNKLFTLSVVLSQEAFV